MKYKHIVFDIDGTLLDTEYAVLQSLQDTVKTYTGKLMEFEDLRFSLGIPGEDTLIQLQIEDVQGAFDLWVQNLYRYSDTVDIFAGIEELLLELKKKGYKLGIVSSKSRDIFKEDFGKLEISSLFSTVICADDTEEHKPLPAPLLKYMEKEKADAAEVIYVGDSIYDSKCADGAHVDFALAVWGSHSKEISADYYPETPVDLLKYIENI